MNTKNLLSAALKQELKTRPLSDITVGEISEAAGVRRQTFYYHFQDINDLVRYTVKKGFEDAAASISTGEAWKDVVLARLNGFYQDRDFTFALFRAYSAGFLYGELRRYYTPLVEKIVDGYDPEKKVSDNERRFLAAFFLAGIGGIALHWIGNGMDVPPEAIIDRFTPIFRGGLNQIVRDTIEAFGK